MAPSSTSTVSSLSSHHLLSGHLLWISSRIFQFHSYFPSIFFTIVRVFYKKGKLSRHSTAWNPLMLSHWLRKKIQSPVGAVRPDTNWSLPMKPLPSCTRAPTHAAATSIFSSLSFLNISFHCHHVRVSSHCCLPVYLFSPFSNCNYRISCFIYLFLVYFSPLIIDAPSG